MHGRPSAVLLAVDDLEALEETIAVLSDRDTVRQLVDSDAELARSEWETEDQLAEILPEPVAFAAHEFIVGPLLTNPHRVGKPFEPPLEVRHSARRGTYRVIYRI